MTKLGGNVRITIDRKLRGDLRAVMEGVLRCEASSPRPDIDVYRLATGSLGAYLVDGGEALPPAEVSKGPWLEFLVEDVAAAQEGLARLGLSPIDYHDKSYNYYQAPGGVVFRLASA